MTIPKSSQDTLKRSMIIEHWFWSVFLLFELRWGGLLRNSFIIEHLYSTVYSEFGASKTSQGLFFSDNNFLINRL